MHHERLQNLFSNDASFHFGTKLYPLRTNVVATLDKLHARHVLPGFADRSAEEKEIEKLTTDITKVRSSFDVSQRARSFFFLAHFQ